jgi:hypothetical protein
MAVAFVPALALLVPAAWGQMSTAMTRNYDPATVTTLKGTVEEVSEVKGPGNWRIVRVLVKSDGETADVHVGPAAFLRPGCHPSETLSPGSRWKTWWPTCASCDVHHSLPVAFRRC